MDSRNSIHALSRALALVFCCLGLQLASAASAVASTTYTTGSGENVVLHIQDTSGDDNEVLVSGGSDGLQVSDSVAFTITSGCNPTALATVVVCPLDGVQSVVFNLGDGDDLFVPSGSISVPLTVLGEGDADTIDGGGEAADELDGGPGNDYLYVSGASTEPGDDLTGGDGNDIVGLITADATTVTLDDQPDDGPDGRGDNIHSDFEMVIGGDGADDITGTPGPDELYGNQGRDQIHGGGGADVLLGGRTMGGSETCDADILEGGPGNDTIGPLNGGDVASGGADDDTFIAADHTFCSNGGVHGEDPGVGDTMSGGSGRDLATYAGGGEGVSVSLDNVADDGVPGRDDNVHSDIEDVRGTDFDDVLIGSGGVNSLEGGSGDDVLDGRLGADKLIGGDGFDAADYTTRTQPVTVDIGGSSGNDGQAGEHDTVGTDIEALWGGGGADHLTGGPGDDSLDGGPGPDVLSGAAGDDFVDYSTRRVPISSDADGVPGDDGEAGEGDTVMPDIEGAIGGDGSDVLVGSPADNFLFGGPGGDRLDGGGGSDYLAGEAGDDSIVSLDGAVDADDCGGGTDTAIADHSDDIGVNCENVGFSFPPANPVPASPLPPSAIDRIAPIVKARIIRTRLRTALRSGLKQVVVCSEACTVTSVASIDPQVARRFVASARRRRLVVARGRGKAAARTRKRIVLRFAPMWRHKLAGARLLRLSVTTTVTDRAHNRRVTKSHVTLR